MKTLESFDFGRSNVDRSTYDWDTILDGNINVLEKGKDFTSKPGTFKMRARQVAKKLGLKVNTASDKEGNIIVQAYKPDADELEMDKKRKEARAATIAAKKKDKESEEGSEGDNEESQAAAPKRKRKAS